MKERIFNIMNAPTSFDEVAAAVLDYQLQHVAVFRRYAQLLGRDVLKISSPPFLPISLFKELDIIAGGMQPERVFRSSRTTGQTPSRHLVADLSMYEQSALTCFEMRYGPPEKYAFLALLPSYLERDDASLVHMVRLLMEKSGHILNGFFLDDFQTLHERIDGLLFSGQPFMLFGVPFALLDFLKERTCQLGDNIVVETGGMKGRRHEMVREELHQQLREGFGVEEIHSEYGMTELLSQAWSDGKGIYRPAPWMKVIAYDINDPLQRLPPGVAGKLHVIDLANLHSCAFIATEDIGRVAADGSFEVLGRIDNSDLRGCNLLAV